MTHFCLSLHGDSSLILGFHPSFTTTGSLERARSHCRKGDCSFWCLISCANTVTIKVTIATTKEGWQWLKPNLREGENKQRQDTNAEQLWVCQQNRHKSLSNTTATGYGLCKGVQGKHHWGDHPSWVLVLPAAHSQPASTATCSTSSLCCRNSSFSHPRLAAEGASLYQLHANTDLFAQRIFGVKEVHSLPSNKCSLPSFSKQLMLSGMKS